MEALAGFEPATTLVRSQMLCPLSYRAKWRKERDSNSRTDRPWPRVSNPAHYQTLPPFLGRSIRIRTRTNWVGASHACPLHHTPVVFGADTRIRTEEKNLEGSRVTTTLCPHMEEGRGVEPLSALTDTTVFKTAPVPRQRAFHGRR